jgi:Protein of unknown function (DUF559)
VDNLKIGAELWTTEAAQPMSSARLGRMPSPHVPSELTAGPFTTYEAARYGVSARSLDGASWRRLTRNVYCWAGLDDTPNLRAGAVALVLPPGGVVSGRSAAWLHGVDLLPASAPVSVTVPRASTVGPRAGVTIRRAAVSPTDQELVAGIPVTSALRTAFDLARLEPRVEAVVCLDALLHAGLVTLGILRSYIPTGHRGWRGVRRAADALADADPAAESPMESRLRLVIVAAGLPRPVVNQPIYDRHNVFLARPDLRIGRVIIEFDGSVHRGRDVFMADLRRQNALTQHGFVVLRYSAVDVYRRRGLIVAQVRAALVATRFAA